VSEIHDEIRKRLEPDFRRFTVGLLDGETLLVAKRDGAALGESILVLIAPEDRVRTIELRRIATIQDVPDSAR
jgi:hypothetical protein